jgi:arsenite methyltransferase
MESANHTIEVVKEYYGRYLQTKKDLQTSACCTAEALPPYLLGILQQIHPEVLDKFYGCGSPLPLELTGKTILDLGCGTGRDCFILSKLVGPHGQVLGIDMTQEQIALAQKHLSYHMDKFHYSKPNLQFIQGYIEDLRSSGIQSGSIDAVISNCVINLSPKKELVFSEIFRVLKPGGELYFSDVFSDRRLSGELSTDGRLSKTHGTERLQ